MRRPLLFLTVIALALAALASAPVAHSAEEVFSPQVVDTAPSRGEEILVGSNVTFYFDQAMDQASVQAAFKATPSVDGTLTWTNDFTAVFQPKTPLARSTAYTFTIGNAAKGKTGLTLRSDYALHIQTPGALEVTQVVPTNGGSDIEATPTITIIFNRPVVALTTIDEMAKYPSPITISPAADGTGTWLSTSIYTFKPKGLTGGVTYTVIVNKGLKDVTDSILANDYKFSFTTVAPRVIEINPNTNVQQVLRDPTINVTFSQPMDHAAAEGAFTLTAKNGSPVPGDFKWNDASEQFTFTPKALLDYGTIYTLQVDSVRARSATGSPLSAPNAVSTFSTIGTPDIVATTPNNKDTAADPFGGLRITFSAPMALKDFKSRVTIDPKPAFDYDASFDDYDTPGFGFNESLPYSTEPSASYTVTIDTTGLVDKYGTPFTPNPNNPAYQIIGQNKIQIKYSTKLYPASADLRTGGDVGLYSAYQKSTRVYSTHRNIAQINLALWSIPMTDFLSIAASNGSAEGYNPSTLLRRWALNVDNPQNVLRYDLLNITDQGPSSALPAASITCTGAPTTQFKVAMKGLVLSDDPRPLNIRVTPTLTGAQVAQLAPGTQFIIIDGPKCQDGYIWWKLTTTDNKVTGWAAEGDTSHYFMGPVAVSQPTAVPGSNTSAAPLKAGAYMLQMDSPQLPGGDPLKHFMLVGTANVTLKVAPRRLMAWVTDLQTGTPLPNVGIQFYQRTYDQNGKASPITPINQPATADANGLAVLDLAQNVNSLYDAYFAVVNDGKNLGVGLSNFNNGIDPYDFNLNVDNDTRSVSAYVYSDRSLYRPGQPVYYRGVLRARNDMQYTMPSAKTVPVEIFDDQNQSIYKKDVPVDAYGSFADTFTLNDAASLGDYRIVARPNFDPSKLSKDGYYNGVQFERDFSVADYRVPEFQVKATADNSQVIQGDKIKVTVDSSFFFGGALNNVAVAWTASQQDYSFQLQGSSTKNYNFTDYNEDDFNPADLAGGNQNQIANGTGRTDGQGKFVIELPADLGKAKTSQTFDIEAQVTDESGQTISGLAQVIVHQGEFYIGAVPDQYVGAANQAQKINLITVGIDSKPKANTDLSLRVVERKWNSVQTVEPDTGRTVWDTQVSEIPVTDGVIKTGDDGTGVYSFTPSHGGIYKVYATSRDSRGNQITTSAFLYVAGPDYVPWRQQNSDRIDLKIDRDNYNVGDTASVLIASPFQGEATALVTVERGSIITADVIKLPTNSTVYKLPITAAMAPNAFVSVVIVKGVDDKNPVATFRMGMVGFNVQADHLKLNISVTADKPQAGPRETVNYKVHVQDYAGKPVQAQVGVGLTDLAVISLLPDTSTPIMDHFYGAVGLSVRTSSTLTISVDQQTQEILSTIKGGGGGGPDTGIFQVRQRFVDTPLWQPNIVTDANGDATVTVTLPDNLTTWRLDARAVTLPTGELNTTLVGQTTFDLTSTKPLLIRPITPRFYVVGDSSVLAAIVNNNTGADQDVTVKIDVKGVTLSKDATQTQKIPSGQRMRFEWPIVVQDTSVVAVTFYANTADNKYTDAAKSAVGQGQDKLLPISRYIAPETTGTGGVIDKNGGDQTEGIVLPRRFNMTQGQLDIRLDTSLSASTLDALTALDSTGSTTTEGVISSFLPNLATSSALTKLGVSNKTLRDQLAQNINFAVQKLYADQHADGGWGWFVSDRSDLDVTAYALIGLSDAAKQGQNIDKTVITNAVKFLQKNVPALGAQATTWQLNQQAFVLYALATAGSGDISRTNSLFSIKEKLSTYARSYLALTYHILQPTGSPNIDTLLSDFQTRAISSATGQHWEEDYQDYFNWNTDTRTTTIVLDALIQIQPTNPLIPNVVRWLMSARTADTWETSQETTWAVIALSDWMQTSGDLKPNYMFDARMNGQSLGNAQTASPETASQAVKLQVDVKNLLSGQANLLKIQRTAGDGTLYYTAHLTAYLPVDQVQPVARGITITRSYSLANDKANKPIKQAAVGDVVKVTLNIVVPNDVHYLVVNDPVPAGAEAVDPNLATTGTIGQVPKLNSADPLSQGWGWWWFSKTELRDDRTVLYATYLPKGTYQFTYTLRAGLPGVYSVIPATAQETYFPDVYGRSDGFLLTLTPATGNDPTNIGQ